MDNAESTESKLSNLSPLQFLGPLKGPKRPGLICEMKICRMGREECPPVATRRSLSRTRPLEKTEFSGASWRLTLADPMLYLQCKFDPGFVALVSNSSLLSIHTPR